MRSEIGLSNKFGFTYDKDPSPACKTLKSGHLHETISQDTGESRGHASNEIEYSVSLLEIVTWVPCAEEVGTTREETSLKYTEDNSETHHNSPVGDETETLQ
jgi:hypothetical protein